eukprot:4642029-Heterocapsa_arctica.AAC.1
MPAPRLGGIRRRVPGAALGFPGSGAAGVRHRHRCHYGCYLNTTTTTTTAATTTTTTTTAMI